MPSIEPKCIEELIGFLMDQKDYESNIDYYMYIVERFFEHKNKREYRKKYILGDCE